MKVAIVPVTPFRQNACVIWDPETMTGALTDPGGDKERILEVVEKHGVKLEKILVTHGHLDHAGAVADLSEVLELPVEGPQKEETFWIDRMDEQGTRFGFEGARSFTPDRWLEDGDEVTVGTMTLGVRHCPGHTPGPRDLLPRALDDRDCRRCVVPRFSRTHRLSPAAIITSSSLQSAKSSGRWAMR